MSALGGLLIRPDVGSLEPDWPTARKRAACSLFLRGLMSSPTVAARKRVLIVDDDRALRHALATLLQGAGYAVEQAGDGSEALAHLRRNGTDVMLLDINLPGMSGLEVLE